MQYITVNIRKPLFANFVYIRSKYLDQARRLNIPLKITIPQGTAVVSVDEWMKDSKVMLKEFKIKGKPMKLIGNFVPIPELASSFSGNTLPDSGIGLEQLPLC